MDNQELLNRFADAVDYYSQRHGGTMNKDHATIFFDIMSDFIDITMRAIEKEQ